MIKWRVMLADSVAKFHLEGLFKLFSYSGLGGVWYRIMYRQQMQKNISFYRDPEIRKRINQIISQLSDSDSKTTYQKAIKFMQRRIGRDRPHVTYPQYFIPELGESSEEEVFVDGGGYIGDTYEEFVKWSHNRFSGYVFFEPSIGNFKKFQSQVKDERINFYNEGIWNKKERLYFSGGVSGGEIVSEKRPEGGDTVVGIDVTAIDLVPECEKATFIKMDIEGSEMKALEGAINTIQRNRPKLAICIYHSNEDMLRIPEWCFKNLKNYCFYVRHHHYLPCDTVFYAIPNND